MRENTALIFHNFSQYGFNNFFCQCGALKYLLVGESYYDYILETLFHWCWLIDAEFLHMRDNFASNCITKTTLTCLQRHSSITKCKIVQFLSSKIWGKSLKKENVQNICTAPRPVCTTAIGHSPRQTCASRRCFLNRQKCSETQKSLPAPPKQQAFTNCNYSNLFIHNNKGLYWNFVTIVQCNCT